MEQQKKKVSHKWWGWGHSHVHYELSQHPGVVAFLNRHFGLKSLNPRPNFQIEKVTLSESRLPKTILDQLVKELGVHCVSTGKEDRLFHSFGKSYCDLIRIRSQKINNPPDVVLFPHNENHIKIIYKIASEHGIAIIPFGGGTSVVGGVEPLRGSFKFLAALNTTRMKSILEVDRISHTVTVQAGIMGPALEESLNSQGFTLGHFPQSFEFSTLGGWIAARSSGQNSILYGGIEKCVISVDMISPNGEIKTIDCPRRADGPNITELITGSEGVLGVITSATLRIHPLPDEKYYFLLAFKDFKEASLAARILVQNKLSLAMIRVSDETETESMLEMSKKEKSTISKIASSLAKKYFATRGFNFPNVSFMFIGLEGTSEQNAYHKREVLSALSNFNYLDLGAQPGRRWLEERFYLPYLRDELLDNHIFVDTLETATSWSNLENLYLRIKESLLEEYPASVIVAHISHLYTDGASLYFTIMVKQEIGNELKQWQKIKQAANLAISENNGIISHHHGIGIDHKDYLPWTDLHHTLMLDIKQTLDPKGLLNPGKLLKS